MFQSTRTPGRRPLLGDLLAAFLFFAVLFASGMAPERASAYRVLCATEGIGCISRSGYDAHSYWSNPVDPTGNNCTNYVAFRLHQRGIGNPGALYDATNWAFRARQVGIRVDQLPTVGSVAQWTRGRYAPKYGHVAYVEKVNRRFVLLSDSNFRVGGSKRWRVSRTDWQWPSNFIHFPE